MINEQRKCIKTLENHSGSWRLFNGLAEHPSSHWFTVVMRDNLKFIEN